MALEAELRAKSGEVFFEKDPARFNISNSNWDKSKSEEVT